MGARNDWAEIRLVGFEAAGAAPGRCYVHRWRSLLDKESAAEFSVMVRRVRSLNCLTYTFLTDSLSPRPIDYIWIRRSHASHEAHGFSMALRLRRRGPRNVYKSCMLPCSPQGFPVVPNRVFMQLLSVRF